MREFRVRLVSPGGPPFYRDMPLLAADRRRAEAWALRAEREFGLRILWIREVV
jgi:hypothetical protein